MASSFALSPVQYGPTPGASKHCQPPRNGRISIIVAPGCMGLADSGIMPPMKYWELVADKLSAAGWSWGYCSAVTKRGWRGGLLTLIAKVADTLCILTNC